MSLQEELAAELKHITVMESRVEEKSVATTEALRTL